MRARHSFLAQRKLRAFANEWQTKSKRNINVSKPQVTKSSKQQSQEIRKLIRQRKRKLRVIWRGRLRVNYLLKKKLKDKLYDKLNEHKRQ